MRYSKPHLSFEAQAQLLLDRGLVVQDKPLLVERLKAVSYYRLSGYWLPFKQSDDTFRPGTTFEQVWRRYCFDRRLRLLVMDPIERVEVGLRSRMVEKLTAVHGPFAHLSRESFAASMSRAPRHGAFPTIHDEFVAQVRECVARSSELFVTHFRSKYASEADLPFWMAAEVMTFGMVLTCFKHLQPRMRKEIARTFVTPAPVLESWLLTINYVRNVCAHHGRLWNRQLSIRPQIPDPKNIPAWHKPGIIPNERSFAVLTLLRHLLQHVAPQSAWERRLGSLLKEYPDVPLAEMGFPVEWRKCPIWAGLAEDL